MRQLGWLHAVPDESSHQRIARTGSQPQKKRERRSRLMEIVKRGQTAEMPTPTCGMYLVHYLMQQIGPTFMSVMGDGPITHEEIRAWQENTGIELDAWEANMIRRLSIAYLGEHQQGNDPERPPPYRQAGPELMAKRIVVAKQIDELFG